MSRQLAVRIWRLVRPYWVAKGHTLQRSMLAVSLLLGPLTSGLLFWFASAIRDITNAMIAKQQDKFYGLIWYAFGIGALMLLTTSATLYLSTWIKVQWRQWLTDYMVNRYLDKKTYYDIALREDLDNPDQRIQEQMAPFVDNMADIPQCLVGQAFQLITSGVIISTISPTLTWFVIGFSVVQTMVTLVLYTPMIRLSFNNTIAEADLRYGLLHVRENAETIAFYRGERSEHAQIWERLRAVSATKMAMLVYQVKISVGTQVLEKIWDLAPYVLLAPLIFSNGLDFGTIGMATVAATSMRMALNVLSEYIPKLTNAAPGAVRLAQILERFDEMDEERKRDGAATVQVAHSSMVAAHGLNLETPGGEQTLARDLNFVLQPGRRLIIVGQTGVGKSSLLRAMAGLWRRGAGSITMPPIDHTMFLPQRPYMILSDLRSQLLYPRGGKDITDAELKQVLERVNLAGMLEKQGGLDAVRDWSKVLSLGEQQRIGFARVLISQARYVFLDEATSAVDVQTEALLYGLLQEEGLTYVSVGHRESILHFHDDALCLFPKGGYQLVPASEMIAPYGEQAGLVEADLDANTSATPLDDTR